MLFGLDIVCPTAKIYLLGKLITHQKISYNFYNLL